MKIIDGRKLADEILTELKKEILAENLQPGLGIILVGDEPSSGLYVRAKEAAAQKLGVRIEKQILSDKATEEEILSAVELFNRNAQIDGILVQLPLPKNVSVDRIVQSIKLSKDVDGFLPESKFDSPFVAAIWRAIEATEENLKGKQALALVKSDTFGRALSAFLNKKELRGDYIVCREKSVCPAEARDADIVVTALGWPGFLKPEMIKKGAILIDGGISRKNGQTVGDIDTASVSGKAKWLAPAPGGVGPLTVALLLKNVVSACSIRTGEKRPTGVK